MLQHPFRADVYKEKYKGIAISLNVLTCALSGPSHPPTQNSPT